VALRRSFLILLAAAAGAMAQTAEAELPDPPGTYAVIETSMGRMVALLYDDLAPVTVKHFIDLVQGTTETKDKKGNKVKRPYYDGLTFHRIIKGFMIQTGDVKGTGAGDCGVPNIKDEISRKVSFDSPGALGMANTGKPDTNTCQFFITVGRASHLDGRHTLFGQVLEGQQVAVAIAGVPTGSDDHPKKPVTVTRVTIQRKQ
jgi:cyclophilin family peptidyl-prolyl cis-trans isomerase